MSTALTGSFYTTSRPRLGEKLAMMKYDPIGEYYHFGSRYWRGAVLGRGREWCVPVLAVS